MAGRNVQLAIVDEKEDFNSKKIFSMPGEDLAHGSLVEWADSIWLVTAINARKDFCSEGRMQRCNYKLKWIDDSGNIIQRWCIVEDGTKYLIGEKTADIMSIGDARIAVTIGKDPDTDKIRRGRRFLIDDMDSPEVLAYQLTKPNKLYNIYNGCGVFRFILNEVNVTDNDNIELRIADYYNWTPKHKRPVPDVKTDGTLDEIVSTAIEKDHDAPKKTEEEQRWI